MNKEPNEIYQVLIIMKIKNKNIIIIHYLIKRILNQILTIKNKLYFNINN